jgi:hypothetical protein
LPGKLAFPLPPLIEGQPTAPPRLQAIRAKLPAIGKQRHVRIRQHFNLAHQSIAVSNRKPSAIVRRSIRPHLHRNGGIRER